MFFFVKEYFGKKKKPACPHPLSQVSSFNGIAYIHLGEGLGVQQAIWNFPSQGYGVLFPCSAGGQSKSLFMQTFFPTAIANKLPLCNRRDWPAPENRGFVYGEIE